MRKTLTSLLLATAALLAPATPALAIPAAPTTHAVEITDLPAGLQLQGMNDRG